MRPITLARNKVDVIVGNPPWINYNQTTDILRDELVISEPECVWDLGWRAICDASGRGLVVLRAERRSVSARTAG